MLPEDPVQIREELKAARTALADSDVSEDQRIDACMQMRRLLMGMFVQVEPELWGRAELKEMLSEAELGIQVMEEHRAVVEQEALKNHQKGTNADYLIRLCKSRIFDVRQRAELFSVEGE